MHERFIVKGTAVRGIGGHWGGGATNWVRCTRTQLDVSLAKGGE